VIRAAQDNAGEPDEDGWVRTVIPIESVRHAHVELMKFGGEARCWSPASSATASPRPRAVPDSYER
jgi:hypothetical protein